jgi:hypothetical protein
MAGLILRKLWNETIPPPFYCATGHIENNLKTECEAGQEDTQ